MASAPNKRELLLCPHSASCRAAENVADCTSFLLEFGNSGWKTAEGKMSMVWGFQLWKNLEFLVLFNQYCGQKRKKEILFGDDAKTFIGCIFGPGFSQAAMGSEYLI